MARIPEPLPNNDVFGRESGLTSLGSSVTRELGQPILGSDADMSAAATFAGAASNRVVDWPAIAWHKVYATVRRLQARIVKAVGAGKGHKVQALVYLLTHSFGGRALAILRVVSNSGAKTAGVDGVAAGTGVKVGRGSRRNTSNRLAFAIGSSAARYWMVKAKRGRSI